ncbi:DNA-binding GntR family transcriptional regulator [Rhodobium orientis]|nr:GntR family transcriptional regulator [Rhodobium orientis]MBB4302922.1 DNA-binding GntR family transcriptional regulator [Rhodobium orientis]
MSSTLESFRPVERKETLGTLVREQLRSAIMAGQFMPGEKLTIRAVAKALDVSLTPAREALFNLVAEGALETQPNGTVCVPEMDENRLIEITKIRINLEGLAAREAAPRLSPELVTKLEDTNEKLIEADEARDYTALRTLNWQFHFAIYEAAEMPLLSRMIESCWLMIGSYLNVLYPDYGQVNVGIDIHREIIKAVKARDAEKLEATIALDIRTAGDWLAEMIRKRAVNGAD